MCVAVRLEFVRNMYVWVCLRIEVPNRLDLAARFFHCAGTYLSEDCNMGILDPTAGNAHKNDIATPSPESNFVLRVAPKKLVHEALERIALIQFA